MEELPNVIQLMYLTSLTKPSDHRQMQTICQNFTDSVMIRGLSRQIKDHWASLGLLRKQRIIEIEGERKENIKQEIVGESNRKNSDMAKNIKRRLQGDGRLNTGRAGEKTEEREISKAVEKTKKNGEGKIKPIKIQSRRKDADKHGERKSQQKGQKLFNNSQRSKILILNFSPNTDVIYRRVLAIQILKTGLMKSSPKKSQLTTLVM